MNRLKADVQQLLQGIPLDTGGGCSVFKAQLLASLIATHDLKTTLDIGVYRGRSLFPQAIAHRNSSKGVVYGVDPWDMRAALQAEVPEQAREDVERWTRETDLETIYRSVVQFNEQHGLHTHCELVRLPSSSAIAKFEKEHVFFDLIHIDGNHDRERVTSDVNLYLPRLRQGGFLVLDDISWESIRPVYTDLKQKLHHVFELVDKANDFAVFWHGSALTTALQIRGRFMAKKARLGAARLRGALFAAKSLA